MTMPQRVGSSQTICIYPLQRSQTASIWQEGFPEPVYKRFARRLGWFAILLNIFGIYMSVRLVQVIICCILLLTSSATGVSSNPCSQTYPGTGPFTEKCTQNMRDRLLELQTRSRYRRGIQLYMAVHSYSQMWLTPWGFSGSVKPSDYSDIVSRGRIMKSDQAAKYE